MLFTDLHLGEFQMKLALSLLFLPGFLLASGDLLDLNYQADKGKLSSNTFASTMWTDGLTPSDTYVLQETLSFQAISSGAIRLIFKRAAEHRLNEFGVGYLHFFENGELEALLSKRKNATSYELAGAIKLGQSFLRSGLIVTNDDDDYTATLIPLKLLITLVKNDNFAFRLGPDIAFAHTKDSLDYTTLFQVGVATQIKFAPSPNVVISGDFNLAPFFGYAYTKRGAVSRRESNYLFEDVSLTTAASLTYVF
jgi:hypothetical protein